MTQVRRFDKGSIGKVERTPQGYVRVPATLTRVGVFKYRDARGEVRRELRLPEEVFKPESLATLASIPLTNEHPNQMLDSANTGKFMIGFTGEKIDQDKRFVRSTLTITDAEAIEKAISGQKQEVSCGYNADVEEKSGVYDGEEYDGIQRNIVYNHVALVPRGRAGREVRLHMDAAEMSCSCDKCDVSDEKWKSCVEQVSEKGGAESAHAVCTAQLGKPQTDNKGGAMPKVMVAGKEFEVSPELEAALKEHMAGMAKSEMDAKASTEEAAKAAMAAKSEVTQVKQDRDAQQARADALAEEVKSRKDSVSTEKVAELVKARKNLEKVAERVLDDCSKLDSMSDKDIKTAVIKARSPEAVLEGKTDAYLDARFDHVAEGLGESDAAGKKLGSGIVPKTDENGDKFDAEAARKRQRQDSMGAWQQPLTAMKKEIA